MRAGECDTPVSSLLFTPLFSELAWDKGENRAPDVLESGLTL